MKSVTIDTGQGTNFIDVEGTAAGTTTIINAESGINQFSVGRTPNKFSVGQTANDLDLIAGPLTINGQRPVTTQSRYTTRDDAVVLIASR